MNPLLNKLLSDEFRTKVAFASNSAVLRFALLRTSEVEAISEAIEVGVLSSEELKEFVEEILKPFKRGVRFDEDFALAAIAVAVEKHHTEFAEEYLNDLSNLAVQELEMVSQVAKQSLRGRSSMAFHRRNVVVKGDIALPLDVTSADIIDWSDELSNVVVIEKLIYAEA